MEWSIYNENFQNFHPNSDLDAQFKSLDLNSNSLILSDKVDPEFEFYPELGQIYLNMWLGQCLNDLLTNYAMGTTQVR